MINEDSSDSDYTVEAFVKPDRIHKSINNDSADLLGNFDDEKRKEVLGKYYLEDTNINLSDNASLSSASASSGAEELSDAEENEKHNQITDTQLSSLLRGAAKANRFVLYVTNLNFETTRSDLETHFGAVATVKSVRIPKKKRGGFAFVEMTDMKGFQKALQQHNTMLRGRQIKVQLSEAGKKKSANKRNILKQKNRKLAEMRREGKAFTKSGKFFDKTLKQEKAKELLARKRWRKKPATSAISK